MKILIYFFMLCSILSLSSCWPGFILFNLKSQAKKEFTIKYDDKYKVDTNKIAINGYYILVDSNEHNDDSTFVLLPDGVYASFEMKDSLGINNISLENNMYHWNNNRPYPFYGSGIYRIDNDTLYAEIYQIDYYYWYVVHLYFCIIDRKTLSLKKAKWYRDGILYTESYEGTKYRFIPATNLPSSDQTFFKKEKWLWKDKKAYKRWKEEYKKTMKKNKK